MDTEFQQPAASVSKKHKADGEKLAAAAATDSDTAGLATNKASPSSDNGGGGGTFRLSQLLLTAELRRPLFVACMLQVIQQFSGINAVRFCFVLCGPLYRSELPNCAIRLSPVGLSVRPVWTQYSNGRSLTRPFQIERSKVKVTRTGLIFESIRIIWLRCTHDIRRRSALLSRGRLTQQRNAVALAATCSYVWCLYTGGSYIVATILPKILLVIVLYWMNLSFFVVFTRATICIARSLLSKCVCPSVPHAVIVSKRLSLS